MIETTDLGRIVRRHRRMLAAALAGTSVLLLGLALRPAAPGTTALVVAARDLGPGHRLAAADLTSTQALTALLPAGTSADPGALEGRVLAAPVGQGEPITGLRLVGDGGWRAAPGTSAVPVRSADPGAAALLSAGQRVDLLAASPLGDGLVEAGPPAPARLVADDVLVLAVVDPGAGSGLLGSAGDGGGDPLVVVEATPGEAAAILGARAAGGLWFTLR